MELLTGTFHDAQTGVTIVRDLTPEEAALIPEATDETPSPA